MGRFINSGNSAFQVALNSEIYVDKTGLLEYTNKVMDTTAKFISNSRPRRFGKSITADMLTAYYGKGCDSEEMFSSLAISKSPDFKKHLNQYVLIRDEVMNQTVQDEYINFLRGMFKGSEPTKYIQLAYLTGILPIKKIKTQSALNNFDEFTMIDAGRLAPYIGFTEEEVRNLCQRYGRDFEQVKRWYDGYILEGYQVYNPVAVVKLMTKGGFKSYWSETGTYEAIVPLINMDFDGLRTAIIEMLSGGFVKVQVKFFQNNLISFANKDDVLTYLIHLGYLGYEQNKQIAFIPNEEIRQELTIAVESMQWIV